MTEEQKPYQLIVLQRPPSSPELEPLLRSLKNDYGLDPYIARVRLAGSGKSLFGSAGREKASELAALLRRHGYTCWIVRKSKVCFAPMRLRGLSVSADAIELICQERTLVLPRGGSVVAILADLSGQLAERVLQRFAVQSSYKKSAHVTAMADDEMIEAVLKGQPALDLYLMGDQDLPRGAVRIFPARFDARGLGERMTMSAIRNLEAVFCLAREYAGDFVLHADFGLGRLPGCQIKSLDGTPAADETVLKNLTRFGWLMCDLQQDDPEKQPGTTDPTLAALAAVTGQPALAAIASEGQEQSLPGLEALAGAVEAATAEELPAADENIDEQWLPAPPERPEQRISARMLLSGLGTFLLAGALALISQVDTHLLRLVARYGVKAGALPGLVSLGLFFAAFHFIRLKRRIEDTPTSRVRSMAMGLVEIHGKAVRKYALVSPMTQSPCIYYRLRKYKKDHKDKWTLRSDRDSRHVPFMIDDGTGAVIVDPQGATVRAKTSRTGLPGEAMLAFHGVSNEAPDEKWIEDIIYEGSSLYVLGFARPVRSERLSLRDRTVEKLRHLKLDRGALLRYDTDGDGRVSADEWQQARDDAEQLALRESLAEGAGSARKEGSAVLAKPTHRGLPFVIAETADEALLIRNYWLISMPLLLLGLVTAGFSLYYFLDFVGM